jgi:hypothetical protein
MTFSPLIKDWCVRMVVCCEKPSNASYKSDHLLEQPDESTNNNKDMQCKDHKDAMSSWSYSRKFGLKVVVAWMMTGGLSIQTAQRATSTANFETE